jgi:hypothetical protein
MTKRYRFVLSVYKDGFRITPLDRYSLDFCLSRVRVDKNFHNSGYGFFIWLPEN